MNFTPLNPTDCAPRSDSCLARSCSRGSLTRSNRFACGDDEPQLRSQPSRPVGHRGIDRRDWLASSYIQYRKEGGSCREPETQRKRAAIAGTFRWGRERADRGISGPQRTWSGGLSPSPRLRHGPQVSRCRHLAVQRDTAMLVPASPTSLVQGDEAQECSGAVRTTPGLRRVAERAPPRLPRGRRNGREPDLRKLFEDDLKRQV